MIDRQTCQHVRADFETFAALVKQKYGLTAELGNIRFCSASMRGKITISDDSTTSLTVGGAVTMGMRFRIKQRLFTVTGRHSGRVYQWKASRDDGRAFKVSTQQVLAGAL